MDADAAGAGCSLSALLSFNGALEGGMLCAECAIDVVTAAVDHRVSVQVCGLDGRLHVEDASFQCVELGFSGVGDSRCFGCAMFELGGVGGDAQTIWSEGSFDAGRDAVLGEREPFFDRDLVHLNRCLCCALSDRFGEGVVDSLKFLSLHLSLKKREKKKNKRTARFLIFVFVRKIFFVFVLFFILAKYPMA